MPTLTLRGLPALARALEKLGPAYTKAAVKGLRRTAEWGRKELVRTSETTKPRPRAWGTYERGWTVMKSRDGAHLVNNAIHAVFVEQGRKPGRAPPVDQIARWVIRKGLTADPSAARGIAFQIAKNIAKKGTEGRFVLARTMPRISKRQEQELKRAFRELHASPPRG